MINRAGQKTENYPIVGIDREKDIKHLYPWDFQDESIKRKKKIFIIIQSRAELQPTLISIEQIILLICRDGKLTYTLSSTHYFI